MIRTDARLHSALPHMHTVLTPAPCSNVVCIRGLGAHDLSSLESLRSSAYLVMEAMEGGDLRMMVLKQVRGGVEVQ